MRRDVHARGIRIHWRRLSHHRGRGVSGIADRYTGALVMYCEGSHTFPRRCARRDDIRPGLRVTNYKKRAVIAFDVDAERVSIIGVFYGGQDYETVLQSDLGH
ncbi:MAG TPA: hypothetical protein VMV40_10135 [Acidiferrobacter sp.]|nr:hypothetical protein [Acidiferrobacter sp.]